MLNTPPYNLQLEMCKQMNNVGDFVGRVLYGVTYGCLHTLCPYGSRLYTEYAQSEIPANYRDNGLRVKWGTLEIWVKYFDFRGRIYLGERTYS